MTELEPCRLCGARLVTKLTVPYGIYHPVNDCLMTGFRAVTPINYSNKKAEMVQWDERAVSAWNRWAE